MPLTVSHVPRLSCRWRGYVWIAPSGRRTNSTSSTLPTSVSNAPPSLPPAPVALPRPNATNATPCTISTLPLPASHAIFQSHSVFPAKTAHHVQFAPTVTTLTSSTQPNASNAPLPFQTAQPALKCLTSPPTLLPSCAPSAILPFSSITQYVPPASRPFLTVWSVSIATSVALANMGTISVGRLNVSLVRN